MRSPRSETSSSTRRRRAGRQSEPPSSAAVDSSAWRPQNSAANRSGSDADQAGKHGVPGTWPGHSVDPSADLFAMRWWSAEPPRDRCRAAVGPAVGPAVSAAVRSAISATVPDPARHRRHRRPGRRPRHQLRRRHPHRPRRQAPGTPPAPPSAGPSAPESAPPSAPRPRPRPERPARPRRRRPPDPSRSSSPSLGPYVGSLIDPPLSSETVPSLTRSPLLLHPAYRSRQGSEELPLGDMTSATASRSRGGQTTKSVGTGG